MLDARAGSGETDAQRLRFLRNDVHALEERCVAFAELAGGGERLGTRQQKLDTPLARRSRGKETEGGGEPMCGGPRRARRRRFSRSSQQGYRGLVALTCRAFDVVRDRRGRRAS